MNQEVEELSGWPIFSDCANYVRQDVADDLKTTIQTLQEMVTENGKALETALARIVELEALLATRVARWLA